GILHALAGLRHGDGGQAEDRQKRKKRLAFHGSSVRKGQHTDRAASWLSPSNSSSRVPGQGRLAHPGRRGGRGLRSYCFRPAAAVSQRSVQDSPRNRKASRKRAETDRFFGSISSGRTPGSRYSPLASIAAAAAQGNPVVRAMDVSPPCASVRSRSSN